MSDNVKLSMTGEALLNATEQSVSLVREDGEFVLRVAEGQLAERVLTRTVKGERVETGSVERVFEFRRKKAQLEAGEGALLVNPDGKADTIERVMLKVVTVDSARLQAQRDAKEGRAVVAEFKKAVGITKVKSFVGAKLTVAEAQEWIAGSRTWSGRVFANLPAETQEKCREALMEFVNKPVKLTQADVLERLAAMAEASGVLTPELKVQVEAVKAEAAKKAQAREARAKEGELAATVTTTVTTTV